MMVIIITLVRILIHVGNYPNVYILFSKLLSLQHGSKCDKVETLLSYGCL